MIKEIVINVGPKVAYDQASLKSYLFEHYAGGSSESFNFMVLRRSIDARKKNIKVNLSIRLFYDEPIASSFQVVEYRNVEHARAVHIIGAGPAGYFAALSLIEKGYRPIIFEQGFSVKERKRHIAQLMRGEEFRVDSNYAYGEGGAGTFSDGKLYTRSIKRGDVKKILNTLVMHGASEDILIDAHPHLGTDRLPAVIASVRKTIEDCGGAVHFNAKLTDIRIVNKTITGVTINGSDTFDVSNLILATGHSARDVYYLLQQKGVTLESKPFAVGVRVEHPQELIDSIQYHGRKKGYYLPAASYSFVEQVNGRGVFSFCMCPGGYIVPAKTEQEGTVVNGMSPSKRNGRFANSGIVVEIKEDDLRNFNQFRELNGLKFQETIERKAYKYSDNLKVPAQRLGDYINKRSSNSIPENSIISGVVTSSLHQWLPQNIDSRLREAFVQFGKKAKGFLTNEAIIAGVESRTSSPVRIPRNPDTFEHIHIKGLYPCGEGAGYAGGIMSSAIDGDRIAANVASELDREK